MSNHDQKEYFSYLTSRSVFGSLYRKWWLYPKINKHLTGLTLDIGCGIGDMLAFRPGTVGTDINEHTVKFCAERGFVAELMQPDTLPFTDRKFDSVLLDNVLEHIENPIPLLGEISRVLKKGGKLVVGVPGTRGWRSDPDHKIEYCEDSLINCLVDAGFEHLNTFFTPTHRSEWISKNIRQYCIYATFSNRYSK